MIVHSFRQMQIHQKTTIIIQITAVKNNSCYKKRQIRLYEKNGVCIAIN